MVVILLFLFFLLLVLLAQLIQLFLLDKKEKQLSLALLKRESELSFLLSLTDKITNDQQSIAEAFPTYLRLLHEKVGWMYHSIFRLDEETQLMPIRFTANFPDWYVEELSTKLLVRVGDASVGRAVATKQPATINLTSSDPRFTNVTSFPERAGYKSVSCYPVIGKLKTHGGFCAYGARENMFTLHDTQFLLTVANIFGATLEIKLFEQYQVGLTKTTADLPNSTQT